MFYDIDKAIEDIKEDPYLLFKIIKQNYTEVILKVIGEMDFNLCDSDGNNVIMCLLKNKYYDLVYKYLDNNLDINHQNNDGDTLLHLTVTHNYIDVKDIVSKILSMPNIILNIKNNNNETVLDKSINHNYLYLSAKILEDHRFNNISLKSFKNYYEAYIKNSEYGKYSKLNNFTLIMDKLSEKKLLPIMKKLVYIINQNENDIKNDFFISKTSKLENIINNMIKETI